MVLSVQILRDIIASDSTLKCAEAIVQVTKNTSWYTSSDLRTVTFADICARGLESLLKLKMQYTKTTPSKEALFKAIWHHQSGLMETYLDISDHLYDRRNRIYHIHRETLSSVLTMACIHEQTTIVDLIVAKHPECITLDTISASAEIENFEQTDALIRSYLKHHRPSPELYFRLLERGIQHSSIEYTKELIIAALLWCQPSTDFENHLLKSFPPKSELTMHESALLIRCKGTCSKMFSKSLKSFGYDERVEPTPKWQMIEYVYNNIHCLPNETDDDFLKDQYQETLKDGDLKGIKFLVECTSLDLSTSLAVKAIKEGTKEIAEYVTTHCAMEELMDRFKDRFRYEP